MFKSVQQEVIIWCWIILIICGYCLWLLGVVTCLERIRQEGAENPAGQILAEGFANATGHRIWIVAMLTGFHSIFTFKHSQVHCAFLLHTSPKTISDPNDCLKECPHIPRDRFRNCCL